MRNTNVVTGAILHIIAAPNAWAADLTSGVAAFAGALIILGCAVVVIASSGRLQKLKRDNEDLVERLFRSERTVDRLQKDRAAFEQQLADKDATIASVDSERLLVEETLTSLREQLEKSVRVDELTGIANLHQLNETLSDEIKRAVRSRRPLSLLLAEIDMFDDYRAAQPTADADRALQKVAASLTDTFRRAGDLVARSGEARFAIVLPGTDAETAAKFAEKLRRSVYETCVPFTTSAIADRMTASVGFVCVPAVRLSKTAGVFTLAETALRQAQADGCNRIAQVAIAA